MRKEGEGGVWVPEVGDAQIRLLAVAKVGLRNEDVAHGQHAQASNLLGRVENDRRESGGHLGVEPNLDPLQADSWSVDWILTLVMEFNVGKLH